jgi:hypothetical protein
MEAPMMKMRNLLLWILIFITGRAISGPGNFMQGDAWEYRYDKIVNSYSSTFLENDTITGTFALALDSIVKKPDTAFWYVTKHDSLRVRKTYSTGFPSSDFDSLYTVNRSYQLQYAIANEVMMTRDSEYLFWSKIPSYFAYYQLPDSSGNINTISNGSSYERKTVIENILANNIPLKMFSQFVSSSSYSSSSSLSYSQSEGDTLVWIDSIGTYQKSSFQHSHSVGFEIMGNTIAEHYTLLKHNGIELHIIKPPTAISNKPNSFHGTLNGPEMNVRCYDISGRTLAMRYFPYLKNKLIIKQYPDGRYGVMRLAN